MHLRRPRFLWLWLRKTEILNLKLRRVMIDARVLVMVTIATLMLVSKEDIALKKAFGKQ